MIIDDDREFQVEVDWLPSDGRGRNAWANHDDATRNAIYIRALAAVELSRSLGTATAETRTDADYAVIATHIALDP